MSPFLLFTFKSSISSCSAWNKPRPSACSSPCERSWGFPARRSTSPPRSWSSSRSGTAQKPQVKSSTWLAETSLCRPRGLLWLAAAGRQSEPPARRWAGVTAPHKSLNDAWEVLNVSHTRRWSVRRAGRPRPYSDDRKLNSTRVGPRTGSAGRMSTEGEGERDTVRQEEKPGKLELNHRTINACPQKVRR